MVSKIVSTEDGSITLFDPETGELYHNRAGAFTEAFKNYVEPCDLSALLQRQNRVCVLDVCFGLGYNSYLFIQEVCRHIAEGAIYDSYEIDMVAIDKDPQIVEILPQVLAFPLFAKLRELVSGDTQGDFISSLSQFGKCEFLVMPQKNVRLSFTLTCEDLRLELKKLSVEKRKFDFIFHDGFSPRKVPELWTREIFFEYASMLSPRGRIFTYSASAAVRGALKQIGLNVGRTAAVGGKSGGTSASIFDPEASNPFVFPLTLEEETRLASRSATPYRDPEFKLTRSEIIANREREMRDLS